MSDPQGPNDPNNPDGSMPPVPPGAEGAQGEFVPDVSKLNIGDVERSAKKQPPGLWVLFLTEMWERFSYYGMRALLVLYLYASTAEFVTDQAGEQIKNTNPGFGWTQDQAYLLYGIYTFMVYLTSIFGGIAADRFLGTHKSMLWGGWIIALGHITLAFTDFFGIPVGEAVTLGNATGSLMTFLIGLSLIIIGTGFFKPCVSVMVGQLYSENDTRRDSGFTLFYMGINIGAMLSPLVAGSLGEQVGWHWGFGAAAVGMIAGIITYQFLRPKYLQGIGLPPDRSEKGKGTLTFVGVCALLVAIPFLPLALFYTGSLQPFLDAWGWFRSTLGMYGAAGTVGGVILAIILSFLYAQPKDERSKLGVIFILAFLGNIVFWTAFEQAGSSLNIFAKDKTDRMVMGFEIPATWYQSVNAATIVIFAPIFSWLWIWLGRRRLDPSTPMKFAIGLWLLGGAFIAMVFGSLQARDEGLAAPYWLVFTYVIYTWGELCLSPTGLSMVTKLAKPRLQSLMMGVWFFTFAVSNLLAGLVAVYSTKLEKGEATFVIDGLPGFYLLLVIIPLAAGVLIAVLTPVLKKMMKGIK